VLKTNQTLGPRPLVAACLISLVSTAQHLN